MHAFLVTQNLFTIENEGNSLACKYCCLSKFVKGNNLGFRCVGSRSMKTIHQTHVVVTTYVGNHLSGFLCPTIDSAKDSELDILFMSSLANEERAFLVTPERTTKCITKFVAESSNTWNVRHICLHRQFLFGICGCFGCPSFSIEQSHGIDGNGSITNLIHRLDVVDTHQVEAESVDVVFSHPILDTLYHIGLHHWAIGSRLVTTTRTIGKASIFLLAEEIARSSQFKIGGGSIHHVIINHIHYHTYACLVTSHHHLLEFVDSDGRVVWIGAITSIWHIVVQGVVAPVVLMLFECGLIDRSIVITRHNMNMCDAQFLQMIDAGNTGIFGQRKIFAQILQSTGRIGSEVTPMHFVNDSIGNALQLRTCVIFPTGRIGLLHVYDSSSMTVYADSFGKDTWTFGAPSSTFLDAKCIETSLQILFDHSFP